MSKEKNKDDTVMICPYCDHNHGCYTDEDFDYQGEQYDYICAECGKVFYCELWYPEYSSMPVFYYTYRKKEAVKC